VPTDLSIPPPANEPTTLTVHLGPDGRYHLTRIQRLLLERDPDGAVLTYGAVARVALRRLLLALLGERADFRLSSCPLRDEYYRLRDMEMESQQGFYRGWIPPPDKRSAGPLFRGKEDNKENS
jgi:hypothetical protein